VFAGSAIAIQARDKTPTTTRAIEMPLQNSIPRSDISGNPCKHSREEKGEVASGTEKACQSVGRPLEYMPATNQGQQAGQGIRAAFTKRFGTGPFEKA
jgi:hypothetical protein